jgi:hypothetical protein
MPHLTAGPGHQHHRLARHRDVSLPATLDHHSFLDYRMAMLPVLQHLMDMDVHLPEE